jgi:hypothetical protein
MFDQPSSTYRYLLYAAAIMAITGWLGLLLLLNSTLPTVGPRWLFFFLLALATTGTALPFIWLLHRRFSSETQALPSTLLRQALLLTLFIELCTWLQINRSLSLPLAILLALGLIVLGILLRIFSSSAWRIRR